MRRNSKNEVMFACRADVKTRTKYKYAQSTYGGIVRQRCALWTVPHLELVQVLSHLHAFKAREKVPEVGWDPVG